MTPNANKRIAFIGTFALATGLVIFFCRPARHVARLGVVKRTIESGRPVLFFEVIGAEKQFLKVDAVYTIEEGKLEERLARWTNGLFGQSRELWPAIIDPLDDTNCESRQFGVIAPSNVVVWRVKADLFVDQPYKRFSSLLSLWKIVGKEPLLPAASLRLKSVYPRTERIASDPITNAPAGPSDNRKTQMNNL